MMGGFFIYKISEIRTHQNILRGVTKNTAK